MKKYIAGSILSEEYTLEVDRLVNIVSDLKWKYFEKYYQEPKFIKMPIWVYVLLERYTRQLIGFNQITKNNTTIPTYMGLQICDTISIDRLEDIEVF